ncbi:DUF3718 domain-containing protein [Alkalimonas amylolytica]|uniref:DUF3718 domain-containing protein n=1 Tax=Alkalimonas amylolytica TaxID=152573 RepID=A0A1H3XZZ8_ALKAM|nr:DUF3718 domain-containing protein [Alkalimonas amylolytica]SEA04184.1 Protein of unknown function [Alkalimonas amylolytica]
MKKAIFALAPLLLSGMTLADPQAEMVCSMVQQDDRNQMRRYLSDNRLNLRNIYDGIRCNDETLLQFAMRNESFEIGSFIVKQMRSAALEQAGYIEWANNNGLGHSPLVNEVRTRIGQ